MFNRDLLTRLTKEGQDESCVERRKFQWSEEVGFELGEMCMLAY
jgi:hypothetical protein